MNNLYCKKCKKICKITPYEEEYYPGQSIILYVSNCCQSGIVDISEKWISPERLKKLYMQELSYKVNPIIDSYLD